MKKIWLVLGLLIVIGACLWIFFFTPEKLTPDNPAGKTVFYTIINEPGVQDENGRYGYELTAYNEKGKEKKLGFSAGKPLRKGAYVQLYNTLIRGVTHWEEITFEELPEAVQQ
ncbi:YxeA family protein [Paenibacillus periandrae]|uniref:YxeA family protein n=1 Tax=Paenibacillus periandrae TaxID=1761741 RepID=UPI001F091935|nr:YxeA family protein [Paenibacillus periandrae]